jgi:hypothetical protein
MHVVAASRQPRYCIHNHPHTHSHTHTSHSHPLSHSHPHLLSHSHSQRRLHSHSFIAALPHALLSARRYSRSARPALQAGTTPRGGGWSAGRTGTTPATTATCAPRARPAARAARGARRARRAGWRGWAGRLSARRAVTEPSRTRLGQTVWHALRWRLAIVRVGRVLCACGARFCDREARFVAGRVCVCVCAPRVARVNSCMGPPPSPPAPFSPHPLSFE